MIFLLSGEGASDIGVSLTPGTECEGVNFEPGPMALFVDKMVAKIWGYSPLESHSFIFISKSSLSCFCRKQIRGITLPGKKKAMETGFFFKNARALAIMAKRKEADEHCTVGGVLFRDNDGTNACARSLWDDKVKSMESGFNAESFNLGVPMIPKPKSEAWLLCAVQSAKYQNCARLEDLSGNDASPKSIKRELLKALGVLTYSNAYVCDLVQKDEIDPQLIQMPSFDNFRNRLETVARQMIGKSDEPHGK